MSASKFWDWFATENERFRNVNSSPDRESLLTEIELHLHQYSSHLWFQVSGVLADGFNELIITAEGAKDRFADVDSLVADAPVLPRWRFLALMPAMGFGFVHEYGEVRLDPQELWFLPLRSTNNPDLLGLRIGVPDFDARLRDETTNSAWLILGSGIGERECAERIQYLEVERLPDAAQDEGYIKLPELGDYLQWLTRNPRS